MCLGAMRMYSGCGPFISDFYDSFSEIAQWQLLFTMLAAFAMKVEMDGEDLANKTYFDWIITPSSR